MTRYWYEVITTEFVDIDFQEIFDFVKKESKFTDIDSIYNEFINNMGYYIRSVYSKTDDLVDEDNDYFFQAIENDWEDFLKEKYGYK